MSDAVVELNREDETKKEETSLFAIDNNNIIISNCSHISIPNHYSYKILF